MDRLRDLLMSDVLRMNELQVWFVAAHLVDVPVSPPLTAETAARQAFDDRTGEAQGAQASREAARRPWCRERGVRRQGVDVCSAR
jgi:hypothetical protein